MAKEWEEIHKKFVNEVIQHPDVKYKELRDRIASGGLSAEIPEFAPVIHYLKESIHTEEINGICDTNVTLKVLRKHADLALWHVSQSDSWYPYYQTIKAMFFTLQFLDTLQRTINPQLNIDVPFYHEYRYLYYLDRVLLAAPNVILIPTYLGLGATPFVTMRGYPIFIMGVNTKLEHVDEYLQTSAEFFIHDLNHARRQYEQGIRIYKERFEEEGISLENYYDMQYTFVQEKIKPLLDLKDTKLGIAKGLRQVIKIILFEILHEDANVALPEIICRDILRGPGHGEAGFQVVYKNPHTGSLNIRKVRDPGGGILAFVKYKLRYGFLNRIGHLNPQIVAAEYRSSDKIAEAAEVLLRHLDCGEIPAREKIMELVDDMAGQNPPAHPNHLGQPINAEKFTGKRPPSLDPNFFETYYAAGVPWTGLEKKVIPLELRNTPYNAGKEEEETAKVLEKKAGGGKRKTRRRQKKRNK